MLPRDHDYPDEAHREKVRTKIRRMIAEGEASGDIHLLAMREKCEANKEALRAAGIPIEDSFAKARATRLRELAQSGQAHYAVEEKAPHSERTLHSAQWAALQGLEMAFPGAATETPQAGEGAGPAIDEQHVGPDPSHGASG
jgi:hypothetical protein